MIECRNLTYIHIYIYNTVHTIHTNIHHPEVVSLGLLLGLLGVRCEGSESIPGFDELGIEIKFYSKHRDESEHTQYVYTSHIIERERKRERERERFV